MARLKFPPYEMLRVLISRGFEHFSRKAVSRQQSADIRERYARQRIASVRPAVPRTPYEISFVRVEDQGRLGANAKGSREILECRNGRERGELRGPRIGLGRNVFDSYSKPAKFALDTNFVDVFISAWHGDDSDANGYGSR